MGLFTVAAGIQMGNTATSSYVVDSYPKQSMSVITFYAVFLNLSAFINPVGSWNYRHILTCYGAALMMT